MPDATVVREFHDVDAARFRAEIQPSGQPALLRGAMRAWPAVTAGIESPAAMSAYLLGYDQGGAVEAMIAPPEVDGHFFYNDQLTGLNFERRKLTLRESLDRLLALIDEPRPPAFYVGAVATPEVLPGFEAANPTPMLDSRITPRVWLGNRVTVQTHHDVSENLACVVAGRRRFTLFPPEQLTNLYVGPLEFTLAGQPISMVRLHQPDHDRFPRFRAALAHAQVAELEPGDALFIPYMWWHHVESLDRFNVLVNYWWDDTPPWNGSPFEALCHALMSVHSLPPHKRAIWEKVFAHHVFERDGDPVAHLDAARRGIQGPLDRRLATHIRSWLLRALSIRRP
jgi:hypothetical protein